MSEKNSKSNETLAKIVLAWSEDLITCVNEKIEILYKLLEMNGCVIPENIQMSVGYTKITNESKEDNPTLADVRFAIARLEKEKGCSAVRNLLYKYGIENLSSLEPGFYARFIKDAEEIENAPC